ncbi:helix-turn-helix domain-containing protein [Curvibacter lanceolatus]|uniref:helix-turn-helix domain-containing protein n=1 Tax=Curvibacter lanceolatus TaxID=86182 RepID=UPI0012FA5C49
MSTRKKPETPKGSTIDSMKNLELERLAVEIADLEAGANAEAAKQPAGRRQPGRWSTPPEDELGARIQESRKAKGLTQGDLADLTKSLDAEEKGISRAVLSLYESGTNRPSQHANQGACELPAPATQLHPLSGGTRIADRPRW